MGAATHQRRAHKESWPPEGFVWSVWFPVCGAAQQQSSTPGAQTPTCLHSQVVDVFAMPQSGTSVSVEAVDPVFQTKMLDMLKQVGR